MSFERFIPSFLRKNRSKLTKNVAETNNERNERVEEARELLAYNLRLDISEVTDDKKIVGDLGVDPTNMVTLLMYKGFVNEMIVINDARKYTIGNLLRNVQ